MSKKIRDRLFRQVRTHILVLRPRIMCWAIDICPPWWEDQLKEFLFPEIKAELQQIFSGLSQESKDAVLKLIEEEKKANNGSN